jgi:hypothetical protein
MNDNEFAGPALVNGVEADWGSERPTRVRYRVLAAACSLAIITYIHRVGFATASAEFKTALGLTDAHIGRLMAAFMIGYGIFEMPWGLLADSACGTSWRRSSWAARRSPRAWRWWGPCRRRWA